MTADVDGAPERVIKITHARLRSAEEIHFSDGLTVIVGPNNAGKSQLLREVTERIAGNGDSPHYRPKVLENLTVEKLSSAEEFIRWLRVRHNSFKPGSYGHGSYGQEHFFIPQAGQPLSLSQIVEMWNGRSHEKHRIAPFLNHYMGPGTASGAISNGSSFHVGREAPNSPLHRLFLDRNLEKMVSDEMHNAFGERLVVHRYAGSQISLHVGVVSAEETKAPPSNSYRDEIENLPYLQDQGDGVRSYMGMVMTVITARYPVLVIDEPETFLHPPQAYMLGRFLAGQSDNGSQVIVATHSSDVLRGIVSAASAKSNVTVVRLTRSADGNHAAQVPVDQVQGLYEDPLIKYFGILDGLFFHGVVLCEADSDCTYYRAVLDSTIERLADGRPTSALNLHFAQCGGKSRIPNAVRALRAARVPVACAVDIDFLQNDHEFKNLVDACGGDIAQFEGYRNVVINAVQPRGTKIERVVARLKISELLDAKKDPLLSPGECEKIRQAVQAETGWRIFKRIGKGLFTGGALEAYVKLDSMLRELGVFLVPVGELEGFNKEYPPDNKAQWLRSVLENSAYQRSPEATTYVEGIANYIWEHQDQAASATGSIVGSA